MVETLYLDLFFLVNLAVDLYLLLLTGLILREPLWKRKRWLFLGAAAGAAMGCGLIFLPKLPLFIWMILELALPAVLMTWAAFGVCGLQEMVRRVLVLWMTAALTGGLFYLSEASEILPGAREAWNRTPWSFWRLGMALSAAGGSVGAGAVFLRKGMAFRNSLYEVTLHYRGKQKTVRALRDTGNQLYEPYGHQPVHILEQSVCRELGESVSEVICVPFCSVGKEHGILTAVRMDWMEVRQQGKQIRILERPWVAISETPLSVRHKYEMLLHGEL